MMVVPKVMQLVEDLARNHKLCNDLVVAISDTQKQLDALKKTDLVFRRKVLRRQWKTQKEDLELRLGRERIIVGKLIIAGNLIKDINDL